MCNKLTQVITERILPGDWSWFLLKQSILKGVLSIFYESGCVDNDKKKL